MKAQQQQQPAVFNPTKAAAAAEEGMAVVSGNTNPAWVNAAELAIIEVATLMQHFIGDDIWPVLDAKYGAITVHNYRALGPIMKRMAVEGYAEPVFCPHCRGRMAKPSARVTVHQKQSNFWRSRVWVGGYDPASLPKLEEVIPVVKKPRKKRKKKLAC